MENWSAFDDPKVNARDIHARDFTGCAWFA
jgi:hypothetical protein